MNYTTVMQSFLNKPNISLVYALNYTNAKLPLNTHENLSYYIYSVQCSS